MHHRAGRAAGPDHAEQADADRRAGRRSHRMYIQRPEHL